MRAKLPVPKPRVIFINRVYWPAQAATAQLLTDLAEALAARDIEVHIIAAGKNPGERHGVTIHRTGEHDTHSGMGSRLRNYAGFLSAARRRLRTLTQPGDMVVILTDPPMLGAALAGIAHERGARVVHWVQDIYPEIVSAHFGGLAAALTAPLTWARNRSWRIAERCVTLGSDMASAIERHKIPSKKITQIPNWAPRELHVPAAPVAIEQRRRDWNLTDKFIVAYSGNLGRVHEFDTIVATADQLRDDPQIVFLFIGHGAQFDQVSTAARARQLTNIRFLPPESRENLPAALAAADAHFVTLRPGFETLVYPSKLAGVLAVGRPVIFVGPRPSELATVVDQTQCGTAVQPGESARLATTIKQWCATPSACAQLRRAARETYENRFTMDHAVTAWHQLIVSEPAILP
jgi:colanic acid biosynthesis glycosyl transferase WcaI